MSRLISYEAVLKPLVQQQVALSLYGNIGAVSGIVGALAYIAKRGYSGNYYYTPFGSFIIMTSSAIFGAATGSLIPPLSPFFGCIFMSLIILDSKREK